MFRNSFRLILQVWRSAVIKTVNQNYVEQQAHFTMRKGLFSNQWITFTKLLVFTYFTSQCALYQLIASKYWKT